MTLSQLKNQTLESGKQFDVQKSLMGGLSFVPAGKGGWNTFAKNINQETLKNPYFQMLQDDGNLRGNHKQCKAYLLWADNGEIGYVDIGSYADRKSYNDQLIKVNDNRFGFKCHVDIDYS